MGTVFSDIKSLKWDQDNYKQIYRENNRTIIFKSDVLEKISFILFVVFLATNLQWRINNFILFELQLIFLIKNHYFYSRNLLLLNLCTHTIQSFITSYICSIYIFTQVTFSTRIRYIVQHVTWNIAVVSKRVNHLSRLHISLMKTPTAPPAGDVNYSGRCKPDSPRVRDRRTRAEGENVTCRGCAQVRELRKSQLTVASRPRVPRVLAYTLGQFAPSVPTARFSDVSRLRIFPQNQAASTPAWCAIAHSIWHS